MGGTKTILGVAIWMAGLMGFMFGQSTSIQPECTYSSDCGQGECRVYEDGRYVCEAKQVGVAVYDYLDMEKIEAVKGARIVCPLGSDSQPIAAKCVLTGAVVTFKKGHTFHYEIQKRGE